MNSSLIISAASLVMVIAAFIVSRHRETVHDTQEGQTELAGIKESLLKVNLKLDSICTSVSETRTDIKAQQAIMQDYDKRLALVEHEQKTMWKRLDELKGEPHE